MQDLTTERLLPRPLWLADAPGMWVLNIAQAMHRYLGGSGGPRSASLADSAATSRFIQAHG